METTGATSNDISAPAVSGAKENDTGESNINEGKALDEIRSQESVSLTSKPSLTLPSSNDSSANSLCTQDQTIIPVDFEEKYKECKQLLEAKTELFQKQVISLTLENDSLTNEYNELSIKHEELAESKERDCEEHRKIVATRDAAIKDKDKILDQNQKQIDRYHYLGGMRDVAFKTKAKRRTGSNKDVQLNVCQLRQYRCGSGNVLRMLKICMRRLQ